MKALQKLQRGYGNLEVVEVPCPVPQENEVVVKVRNRGTWEKTINLLRERRIDSKPLITGEIPLTQWREVFQLFEEGRGLKYLLYPIN